MTMQREQAELLAQVAHLYFEKGDDQSAIARRLRVSRSSVSRLLSLARKSGIVEIRIHYPLNPDHELEKIFCERFGLKQALILKTTATNSTEIRAQVARQAARYLETHLAPNTTVAISRGRTLHAMVEQFTAVPRRNINVVQLVGTLQVNRSAEDDANLARALAQKIGGEYYNLTAPLFVENIETRRALLSEPSIARVLDLARHAKLAVVGIGSLDRQSSAIVRQKLLATHQVEKLRQGHAVGEICSQYFNIHGNIVSTDLSERTMALELGALKEMDVLGVATGAHKAKAILGALRGGYVGVMITDEQTAKLVLDLERPRARTQK